MKTIQTDKDEPSFYPLILLKNLKKKVDFSKQTVLLFAWRGSGQDRIEYTVAESFPEQVHFSYRPGRTRDLRSHAKVYVLRSNVKWSMK